MPFTSFTIYFILLLHVYVYIPVCMGMCGCTNIHCFYLFYFCLFIHLFSYFLYVCTQLIGKGEMGGRTGRKIFAEFYIIWCDCQIENQ